MELIEAINALEGITEPQCTLLCDYDKEAINTVLNELKQVKADLYSANCIIDDLVSNKVEWISIHDRLPEEETKVLVCSDWQCIEIGYVYSDEWFTWDKNERIDFVTHWAELPELPKEVE